MLRNSIILLVIFLLAGCNTNEEWQTNTVTGKVSHVDPSEGEMIIAGREFYIDPAGYETGDILRVTFKDPTSTEAWTPGEYEIESIEEMPDDYFKDYKKVAWDYLSADKKEQVVLSWERAAIDDGIASLDDINQELFKEEYDRRNAYFVTFVMEGEESSYTVIVDKEKKKVIGLEHDIS